MTNQGRSQFYDSSHEFTFDDNLKVIRIPEPAFAFEAVPGYRNVFRSRENGTYVVERKIEKREDCEVEYIKEVSIENGEYVCSTESWTIRAPTY